MSESDLPKLSAQLDDLRNALRGWFCAILEQYPANTKGTTVTDQTVSVPLDMLKELKDVYRKGAGYDAHAAIADILDLIPNPPKVGDTLTAAAIKELPRRAVVRDSDGDLWVADGSGTVTLLGFNTDGRVRNDGGTPDELAECSPVLVFLPGNA